MTNSKPVIGKKKLSKIFQFMISSVYVAYVSTLTSSSNIYTFLLHSSFQTIFHSIRLFFTSSMLKPFLCNPNVLKKTVGVIFRRISGYPRAFEEIRFQCKHSRCPRYNIYSHNSPHFSLSSCFYK